MKRIPDYEYVCNFYKTNGCELLEEKYVNNTTPMRFRCSCGSVTEKTWEYYRLAPRCAGCGDQIKRKNKHVLKGVAHTYEYVKNFIEIESNSGCTLLSEDYVNNRTPLKMLCACGEEFSVSFQKFRSPRRKTRHCKSCSSQLRSELTRLSYQEVKTTIESRGCKLVSDKYVDAKSAIRVVCVCGDEYEVTYDTFRSGQDRCAMCSGKTSRLEFKTEEYLLQNGVQFEKEYKIPECKDIKPLPFDFAVMGKDGEIDFLVEVDGQQHFYPVEVFGGEEAFVAQKRRDAIKDNFCEENNILLVRIPYYDIEDISDYLKHLI